MLVGLLKALVLRLTLVALILALVAYLIFRLSVWLPWLLRFFGIHVEANVCSSTKVENFSITFPKGPLRCISISSIEIGSPLTFTLLVAAFLGTASPVALSIKGVRVIVRPPATTRRPGTPDPHGHKGSSFTLPLWPLPLVARFACRVLSMVHFKASGLVVEVQAEPQRMKVSLSEFSFRCSAPSGSKSKMGVELVELQVAVYQGGNSEASTANTAGRKEEGNMQLLGSCPHLGSSAVLNLHRLAALGVKVSVAPIRVALTQDLLITAAQQLGPKPAFAATAQCKKGPPDVSLLFQHCPEKVSVRMGSIAVRMHPGQKLPEASLQLDAALQQLELSITKPCMPGFSTKRKDQPINLEASLGPLLFSVLPVRPQPLLSQEQQFRPFVTAPSEELQQGSASAFPSFHTQLSSRVVIERRALELKLGLVKLQASLQCTCKSTPKSRKFLRTTSVRSTKRSSLDLPSQSGDSSVLSSSKRSSRLSKSAIETTKSVDFTPQTGRKVADPVGVPDAAHTAGTSQAASGVSEKDVKLSRAVSMCSETSGVHAEASAASEVDGARSASATLKQAAPKELQLKVDVGVDVANVSCSFFVPMLTQMLGLATEAVPALCELMPGQLLKPPVIDVKCGRRTGTAGESFDGGPSFELSPMLPDVSAPSMQLPNRAFRLTHEMEEFELEVEPRPFTPACSSIPATPAVLSDSTEGRAAPPGVIIHLRFAARATVQDAVQVLLSNEPGEAAWQLQLGRMDVGASGAVSTGQKNAGENVPKPGLPSEKVAGGEPGEEDVSLTGKLQELSLHVWHARPDFGVPLRPNFVNNTSSTRLLHLYQLECSVTIPTTPQPAFDPSKSTLHPLSPDPFIPIAISSQLTSLHINLTNQALSRGMDGLFPIASCTCSSLLEIQHRLRLRSRASRASDTRGLWLKRPVPQSMTSGIHVVQPDTPRVKVSEVHITVTGGLELSYSSEVEYTGKHLTVAERVRSNAVTLVRVGRVVLLAQPLAESAKADVQSVDVVLQETIQTYASATKSDGTADGLEPKPSAMHSMVLSAEDDDCVVLGVDVPLPRTLSEEMAAAVSGAEMASNLPAVQEEAVATGTTDKSSAMPINPANSVTPSMANGGTAGHRSSFSHSTSIGGDNASAQSSNAQGPSCADRQCAEVVVVSLSRTQVLAALSDPASQTMHTIKVYGKKVTVCVEVDVVLCWLRVAEEVAGLVANAKQRMSDLTAMVEDAAGELGYSTGGNSQATQASATNESLIRTKSGNLSSVSVTAILDEVEAHVKIGMKDQLLVALKGVQADSLTLLLSMEFLRIAQNGSTLVRGRQLSLSLLDPLPPMAPPSSNGGPPASPKYASGMGGQSALRSQSSLPRGSIDDERQILLRRQSARERVGASAWAPEQPNILSLKISAQQVVVQVPHDRWPGRLYFYSELWVEAVLEVVRPYVDAVKQALGLPPSNGSSKQREDFVELVFDIQKVSFGLDSHPLEHWFALHGPALAAIAGRRQLQERILEHQFHERSSFGGLERTSTHDLSDKQGGGSCSRSQAESEHTNEEDRIPVYDARSDEDWVLSMEDLYQLYRNKCLAIRAACSSELHHRGSLMHVVADSVHAVIMISNDQLEHVQQAALSTLLRVDPISKGIRFSKLDPISLDVSLNNLVCHFSGAEPSTARIGRLHGNGLLVRARQLAARPTTFAQTFPVGCYHSTTLHLPVKGSRPPAKTYTDFTVQMDDMYGVGTMGLMTSFAQLAVGFKRIIPPDFVESDGGPSNLERDTSAWWDVMRYQWRGNLMVRIRNMSAAVGKVTTPSFTEHDERLVMQAATFNVGISAGRIEVVTTDITAAAWAHHPVLGLGETMLYIPYMELPMLQFIISGTWEMPDGRHWMQHHIFPMWDETPPSEAVQEPLDTARLIEGKGWTMAMDIDLRPDSSNTARPAPAQPCSPDPGFTLPTNMSQLFWLGGTLRQSPIPRVYIGELQWAFLMDFVDLLSTPPVWIERAATLRSYFSKKEGGSGRPTHKETPLPQLQRRIDVNLTASIIDLWHDALMLKEQEDPSHNTYLRGKNLRYQNSFVYHHVTHLVKLSNGSKTRVQQLKNMVALSVEMYTLKVVRGKDELMHELQAMRDGALNPTVEATRARHSHRPSESQVPDLQYPEPAFENGLILSVACLLLRQATAESAADTNEKRVSNTSADSQEGPIRIVVQDVHILCPKELRDTIIALSLHIHSALSVEVALLKPQRVDSSVFETLGDSRGDKGVLSPRDTNASRPASPLLRSGAIQSPGRGSPHSTASRKQADAVMALNRARRSESVYQHALALKEQAMRDEVMRQEDGILETILQQNCNASNQARGTASEGSLKDNDSELSELFMDEPEAFENMDILIQTLKPDQEELHHMSQSLAKKNKGVLEYEIEFVHIQVNLMCPGESGSLLLGANSALLCGHRYPELNERTLSFSMDQVQAHMLSTPDPASQSPPITWLKIVKGNLQPEVGKADLHKNVLRPFKVHLCQSEVIQNTNSQDRTPISSPRHNITKKNASADRATRELTVTVPEIDAELDSKEFDMLMDIIQNLLAPFPKVDLLTDYDVPFEEGVDDQINVKQLAASLAFERMQKRCLQQERLALSLGSDRSAGDGALQWIPNANTAGCEHSPLAFLSSERWGTGTPGGLVRSRNIQVPSQVAVVHQSMESMMDWITLQVRHVQHNVEASVADWKEERAKEAKRLLKPRVSSRTLVSVSDIRWILTIERNAFVEASLKDITFNCTREQDYSGNTKVQLRSIELTDLQGTVGPAPDMKAGVILKPWKPDNTWEDDEMLRMFLINGPVQDGKVVYEHLEVLVHPVMVHMTMGLGKTLGDYFTKDVSSTAPGQLEDISSKPASRASTPPPNVQHQGLQAIRTSFGGAAPLTPKKGAAATTSSTTGWRLGSTSRVGRLSSSQDESDSTSQLTDLIGVGVDEASLSTKSSLLTTHTSQVSLASSVDARPPSVLKPKRDRIQKYTVTPAIPKGAGTLQNPAEITPTRASAPDPSTQSRKCEVTRNKFKHVRFNNFYSRITFEGQLLGTTLSFEDWTLVLDTGVFRNLDVTWRELLDKYRREVLIGSLVKSVSGLQTKKINILKDHPHSDEHMLKKAAAGLKGKISKINIFRKDRSKKASVDFQGIQFDPAEAALTGAGSDSGTEGGQTSGYREKRLVPEADRLVREHVKAKKLQHLLGQVPPLPTNVPVR